MAVSVVKKLERFEGKASRHGGEATENYHVLKYKIKIKDFSSNPVKLVKFDRVMSQFQESLNHVAPSYDFDFPSQAPLAPPASESSPLPASSQNLHEPSPSKTPSSTPPYIIQSAAVHDTSECSPLLASSQSLREPRPSKTPSSTPAPCIMRSAAAAQDQERLLPNPSLPLKLQQNPHQEEDLRTSPCKLQPSLQKREDQEESSRARSPCKLQENAQEQENVDEAWLEGMSRLYCNKIEESTLKEEEEKSWARSPWKLQKQEKKLAGKPWEVEKMECECCGMEEECTRGYEERVRGELCGHWLCGLCGEAVREERKRLGGAGAVSMQAAIAAHMQPCRRFSSRARSKASPPPSDVALPHAVCRLLRRHLSIPPSSSSSSPRPSPSLSRSSSSLPKP